MGAAKLTQDRGAVIVSAPPVCCVSGLGCGDGAGGEGGADGGVASARSAFNAPRRGAARNGAASTRIGRG
eukprot:1311776-Pleurochrysis_carterae.AAC.1